MSAFAAGKNSFGFCDKTGFRYKTKDLVPEIVNQRPTGFLVGKDVVDPDQPQLQLGKVKTNDPRSLRNPRPDRALDDSRKLFAWNPVGGGNTPLGSRTLGLDIEVKTAIQDYLETTETTFVSNLPTIIKQAEDRILKSVQLPDFRKNSTGVMANGNKYLQCPDDFLSPYSLALDNSGYEFLIFKDVNFIREAYPVSTVKGTPKYYGIFDAETFILGPTPDTDFAVELHYFHKPESITESSDGTSWLGTNAESTLLYGSIVEAYTFLKGEADLMQLYVGRYQEAISNLKILGEGADTTDSYRSGSIRQARS